MQFITFSTVFPSYHPRAGQPTHFVEKIWNSLPYSVEYDYLFKTKRLLGYGNVDEMVDIYQGYGPKHHTIRAGHRWKVGDWFKPVIWGDNINHKSGRRGPYHSKQVQFAEPLQIKKVWNFQIDRGHFFIEDYIVAVGEDPKQGYLKRLAANDGLSVPDLLSWFKYPKAFDGQIISWSDNIEY